MDETVKAAVIARCRLADARKWFAHLGWDVLPQGIRGQRILRWGADHAWLAASENHQASVRRWCRRWAPWLAISDLSEILEYVKKSNKRWSADQCATALEVSVADRTKLKLRHIGADDDPNYEVRLGISRAKAAERAGKYRAQHRSPDAKRGRPALELSPDEKLARKNAQAAERMRRYRALRKNPSWSILRIDVVTEFSVTPRADQDPLLPGSAAGA